MRAPPISPEAPVIAIRCGGSLLFMLEV